MKEMMLPPAPSPRSAEGKNVKKQLGKLRELATVDEQIEALRTARDNYVGVLSTVQRWFPGPDVPDEVSAFLNEYGAQLDEADTFVEAMEEAQPSAAE